jgi:glycine hydroxymethyltransferase
MFDISTTIESYDPEVARAIASEEQRQEEHIELIASENYASPRVMAAQGSVLTNKYAEGYPGKRYYGGCEFVDDVETLAIERAKELFQAAYANVQPHSGSQANAAVYHALVEPGDTIMGMNLNAGGHLTHGSPVNFSGKLFNVVPYGIDNDTGLIDYDDVERLAREHKPRMIVAGFSAYSQVADWARFREIADSVGAYLFVDMAHVAGLNSLVFPGTQGGPLMHVIAAKAVALKEALEPEFREYQAHVIENAKVMAATLTERGYPIISGGTENHLMLVSLIDKGITGKDADAALGRAYITVNKNSVPNDPQSPFVTSGLRLGTPAITTRGFGAEETRELTGWIADILDDLGNEETIERVRGQVLELCARFPVYGKRG